MKDFQKLNSDVDLDLVEDKYLSFIDGRPVYTTSEFEENKVYRIKKKIELEVVYKDEDGTIRKDIDDSEVNNEY